MRRTGEWAGLLEEETGRSRDWWEWAEKGSGHRGRKEEGYDMEVKQGESGRGAGLVVEKRVGFATGAGRRGSGSGRCAWRRRRELRSRESK